MACVDADPESRSVEQVETGEEKTFRVGAIKEGEGGFRASEGTRVARDVRVVPMQFIVGADRVGVSIRCVEEVFGLRHHLAHPGGPFEDLGLDIYQEGIGGPPSQNHDLVDRFVGKEEGHCCT